MAIIFKDLLPLLGLKSTDTQIVDYFASLGIKVPKWRNVNQGSLTVEDKATRLNYKFEFNIINDAFYPPVSVKNDGYRFVVHLSSIYITLSSRSKCKPQLPPNFWEGFLAPDANEESYKEYFVDGGVRYQSYAEKSIDELRNYKVFYSLKENKIRAIQAEIIEHIEYIGHSQFTSPKHHFNSQSYLLVVKWLFDQKRLLLPDSVYEHGLDYEDQELTEFTKTQLLNHLWDTQIKPMAPHFFYNLTTDVDYNTNNGEKANIYLKKLFLMAAGTWGKYQELYQQSEFEEMDTLYLSTRLNNDQKREFVRSLESIYQDFTIGYKKESLFV